MTDLLTAFLDFQTHGRRPENVILRIAAAYGTLQTIFMPKNLTDVNSEPFRNVVFYTMRIPPKKRWGFVLNTLLVDDIANGLAICVAESLYPMFRMEFDKGIICVYDRLGGL